MTVSKRSSRRTTLSREDGRPTASDLALVSPGKPKPFWGWIDLALYVAGMLLLVTGLYQIVLHFGLSAAAAGAITVKKALERVSGVSKIAVNYPQKEVAVTYDDAKTNEPALAKATSDVGFPSQPVKSVK